MSRLVLLSTCRVTCVRAAATQGPPPSTPIQLGAWTCAYPWREGAAGPGRKGGTRFLPTVDPARHSPPSSSPPLSPPWAPHHHRLAATRAEAGPHRADLRDAARLEEALRGALHIAPNAGGERRLGRPANRLHGRRPDHHIIALWVARICAASLPASRRSRRMTAAAGLAAVARGSGGCCPAMRSQAGVLAGPSVEGTRQRGYRASPWADSSAGRSSLLMMARSTASAQTLSTTRIQGTLVVVE